MTDIKTELEHRLVLHTRPYRLCFTLMGLPKILSNGSHSHWRVASAEKKIWRARTAGVAAAFKPPKPLKKAKLTLIRRSSNEPDYDNLAISFKSVVDGLKDASIIADDKQAIVGRPLYIWEKAPPSQGAIVILVEEVNEVPGTEKEPA